MKYIFQIHEHTLKAFKIMGFKDSLKKECPGVEYVGSTDNGLFFENVSTHDLEWLKKFCEDMNLHYNVYSLEV
ncbi:MAG: hypothetical protein LBP82_04425 [Candidatus Methanoplasma sp.]|jgi:hypothetical protein|nr:hypothetical protein [Candidatus Methanoplasma sp.]